MSSFNNCQDIEARSLAQLVPYFRSRALDGQFVMFANGERMKDMQLSYGDAVWVDGNGRTHVLEFKAEVRDTGNLFMETWSNMGTFRQGWFYTSKADILVYHFLDTGRCFAMPFKRLREWALDPRGGANLYKFPEVPQSKHDQHNSSFGRLVNVQRLLDAKVAKAIKLAPAH